MRGLLARMIGAARLDTQTYEEVEADKTSASGAVFIVVISSIAAAIGSGMRDAPNILGVMIASVLTWLVWVGLTYLIGTRLLPGRATNSNFGEVLRTTGFSAAPGVLQILGIVPVIGVSISLAVTFWMLLTFVVAIRQALDYSTIQRAFAVCILGWLIHGLVFFAFVRSAI